MSDKCEVCKKEEAVWIATESGVELCLDCAAKAVADGSIKDKSFGAVKTKRRNEHV